MYVTVTAYSSTNSQTDDTPYITAYSTPVRDGIVAANFLPIGTVIRFPDKFEDKLFVVEDKMSERYSMQVDIWMSDQEEAKKFGIQYLKAEIF
ncbi:3D domain-containing protein [Candidatus Parcubacteria bacterium]|nr:3D domain-containing protein [Patescibacteria group bacterium]MCG2687140.1 3D domain-containing protein [Candidatus Parcubacteria bacterium]